MIFALFASFFGMIFVGVPIAAALGVSSLVAIVASGLNVNLIFAAESMFTGTSSYELMAIPFFILCGNLMGDGGLSKKLVNFINLFFSRIQGGLSFVTIASSMFFAAISGSSPATTAAIGGIMVPEMKKAGYDSKFAAATAAAGGTVGQVIPPSIGMVTYCVLAEVSIGKMFVAGIGPGILMGIMMMLYAGFYSKKNNVPVVKKEFSLKIVMKTFAESIWALIMPLIILGGIYLGLFTPTEAGAIAAVYGLVVSKYIYKTLEWKTVPKILIDTAIASAVIMLIMASVKAFSFVLTRGHIPQIIAENLLSITDNKYLLLLLFNIFVLFAGMFLNAVSAIALITPIMLPIMVAVGVDPILLGIILIVNLGIGMITPPVGNCLYVACNISNQSFEDVSKASFPYVIVLSIGLMLITYFDFISLGLVWLMSAG
jgi:C4-dicarboxylate transporter DctM subunit